MQQQYNLWSVRGFQYEEHTGLLPGVAYFRRKLFVIDTDLTYQRAKEIVRQFKHASASIFPNTKKPELQVIQLSDVN